MITCAQTAHVKFLNLHQGSNSESSLSLVSFHRDDRPWKRPCAVWTWVTCDAPAASLWWGNVIRVIQDWGTGSVPPCLPGTCT